MKEITPAKITRYLDITKRALAKVKIISAAKEKAEDALDMATRYYQDALHFHSKGDFVNAFACVNYAHGWLDCGARTGLFDVGGDNQLFTVDEE
jgi:hypothetical protein|tara:strand:+ start:294 stop:575 length:282 start_codon:yes stop_codon:yes gene_type:complete